MLLISTDLISEDPLNPCHPRSIIFITLKHKNHEHNKKQTTI